jgi:hypothetical protein
MSWIAAGLRVTDLGIDISADIGDVVVTDIGKEDGGWNWNIINWLLANVLNLLQNYGPMISMASLQCVLHMNCYLILVPVKMKMYGQKFGSFRCRKE